MRFFALYRERAGASGRGWELPESATLAELLREIRGAYPDLAPPDVEIVAAVNEEYAEGGLMLREGDEVALIPPVSGGGAAMDRPSSHAVGDLCETPDLSPHHPNHPHPNLPPSRGKGQKGRGRGWTPAFAGEGKRGVRAAEGSVLRLE